MRRDATRGPSRQAHDAIPARGAGHAGDPATCSRRHPTLRQPTLENAPQRVNETPPLAMVRLQACARRTCPLALILPTIQTMTIRRMTRPASPPQLAPPHLDHRWHAPVRSFSHLFVVQHSRTAPHTIVSMATIHVATLYAHLLERPGGRRPPYCHRVQRVRAQDMYLHDLLLHLGRAQLPSVLAPHQKKIINPVQCRGTFIVCHPERTPSPPCASTFTLRRPPVVPSCHIKRRRHSAYACVCIGAHQQLCVS